MQPHFATLSPNTASHTNPGSVLSTPSNTNSMKPLSSNTPTALSSDRSAPRAPDVFDNLLSFGSSNSANKVAAGQSLLPTSNSSTSRQTSTLDEQRRQAAGLGSGNSGLATPKQVVSQDSWATFSGVTPGTSQPSQQYSQQLGFGSSSGNNLHHSSLFGANVSSSIPSSIPSNFGAQFQPMTPTLSPSLPNNNQQQPSQQRTPSPDKFGDLLGGSGFTAGFGSKRQSTSPSSMHSMVQQMSPPKPLPQQIQQPESQHPQLVGFMSLPCMPMGGRPSTPSSTNLLNSSSMEPKPLDSIAGGGTWDWEFLAQPKPSLLSIGSAVHNTDNSPDPFDVSFLSSSQVQAAPKLERQVSHDNPLGILGGTAPVTPKVSSTEPTNNKVQRLSPIISPPASRPSTVLEHDHALASVMDAGFDLIEASNALEAAGGDITLAIELLQQTQEANKALAAQLHVDWKSNSMRNNKSTVGDQSHREHAWDADDTHGSNASRDSATARASAQLSKTVVTTEDRREVESTPSTSKDTSSFKFALSSLSSGLAFVKSRKIYTGPSDARNAQSVESSQSHEKRMGDLSDIETVVSKGLDLVSSMWKARNIIPKGINPVDASNDDVSDYVKFGDNVPYRDDSDGDEESEERIYPSNSSDEVAVESKGGGATGHVKMDDGKAYATEVETALPPRSLSVSQAASIMQLSPPRPTKPVVVATPEQITVSDSFKEKGNVLFKQGQFGDAEAEYTQAITILPPGHLNLVTVYNNRAAARLKTGQYKGVVDDAAAVLEIDKRDCKSLLRRAAAYEAMEKWAEARDDYKRILSTDATVKGVSNGLSRCQKALELTGKDVETGVASGINNSAISMKSSSTTFAIAEFDAISPKPMTTSPAKVDSQVVPDKFELFDPVHSTAETAKPVDPYVERAVKKAVDSLRQAHQLAEAEDAMKLALKDQIDLKMSQWRHGKEANLRALLASMETVWNQSTTWQNIQMSELITPQQVKIKYMKTVGRVHPDKLARDATLEQQLYANAIFSTLNKAWDAFKAQNGL
ncbi:hypothetical protein SeMB42_g01503 [Synchytrium endobioticum]|uniref:UBA domain-containing protein n=1 Tax=Synchytrium endobioticum TaxID=286115 RepID=A0A507DLL0_9FUNG|nr:hypothetical protein SeLEV6574_g01978 [Synchytrium endobioticum]TPX52311.1 hypothetical protein SeMB42_g01503 [Synchytrium endobioticum]